MRKHVTSTIHSPGIVLISNMLRMGYCTRHSSKPTTMAAPVTAVPADTIHSLFKFIVEEDLPLDRLRLDAQR